MTDSNGRAEFTSVHPVLAVHDLGREIAYYVETLGFTLSWEWGEPPVRAGVQRDGLELQLVADGRFAPAEPSYVYFQIRGVDSYFATCVERGAEIVMTLGDRPFGVRDFRIVDPSGNKLGFGEPIGADREGAA
jgi:predicted enzyme related to lactoylglutathione lyase